MGRAGGASSARSKVCGGGRQGRQGGSALLPRGPPVSFVSSLGRGGVLLGGGGGWPLSVMEDCGGGLLGWPGGRPLTVASSGLGGGLLGRPNGKPSTCFSAGPGGGQSGSLLGTPLEGPLGAPVRMDETRPFATPSGIPCLMPRGDGALTTQLATLLSKEVSSADDHWQNSTPSTPPRASNAGTSRQTSNHRSMQA